MALFDSKLVTRYGTQALVSAVVLGGFAYYVTRRATPTLLAAIGALVGTVAFVVIGRLIGTVGGDDSD